MFLAIFEVFFRKHFYSDDSSSAESDATSEASPGDRYAGYETLPNAPDSTGVASGYQTAHSLPPTIQRSFEQASFNR